MFWLITCAILASVSAFAVERDLRIPDEYELAGSSSLGVLNTGAAEASGVNAIQVNPALLALNREYSVSASYHWPSQGRDLYRLGVVDGTTSRYVAGASFVGFQGNAEDNVLTFSRDSQVLRRASVGVSYPFKWLAVGGALYYVEGRVPRIDHLEVIDGMSLGIGAVAYLSRNLKIGASVQNLNNDKVKNFSPRFIKAGLAIDIVPSLLSAHLDYRQRNRIESLEGDLNINLPGIDLEAAKSGLNNDEKMVFVGGTAAIYNLMKLSLNYGRSLDKEDRRESAAGSLGIYHQKYSLVYTVSQPYLEFKDLQSSLSLQVFMKI